MTQVNKDLLDLENTILQKLHAHLKEQDRFPHRDQSQIIRAFFNDKKKIIMGQCGRSFGKTEQILYITYRYAATRPNSEIYIVCPETAQGKRIYWISRRLQNYGPQEFIFEQRDSELRVVFKNGSYIMVVGCDNYESLRGIKPHLVVYDEFQHHSKYFDEEVMQPNLSSGKVSLVVMGTPPRSDCYYIEFRKNLLDNIAKGEKDYFYVELPSTCNPTVDKVWVAKKRDGLTRRGKLNVYLREYEGKLVFDTENAIFPFFDKKKHVKPHKTLMNLIMRDRKKLNWYALFDPGTATCFAGLFKAVNPYTSQVYILGNIYAKEKVEMTAQAVWIKAEAIKLDLYPYDDWMNYYDEAAAWFANEIQRTFDAALSPTRKQTYEKKRNHDEGRAGESLLNTLMMADNKFFVSDRCESFIWEIENYVTNDKGEYPKKNDHLMDLLFYWVNETGYEFYETPDKDLIDETTDRPYRRQETIEVLMEAAKRKQDLSYGIEPDYFDFEDDMWN